MSKPGKHVRIERKETEPMERREAWEELEIKNDFLFAKVMRDKRICMMLLEKLLQTKIKDVVYLEEQKVPRASQDRL